MTAGEWETGDSLIDEYNDIEGGERRRQLLRVPDAKSALFLRQELLLIDEFIDIEGGERRRQLLRVPDTKSALFLRQELLLIDEFNDIEAEKYRQLQK